MIEIFGMLAVAIIFGGSGIMFMYGLFVAPFHTMNKELKNENLKLQIKLEEIKNEQKRNKKKTWWWLY